MSTGTGNVAPGRGIPPRGRLAEKAGTGDIVLDRLEHQIDWYDRAATRARIVYALLKVVQIGVAAAVPVAAAVNAPALVTGALGGVVVVVEGLQQLFRFHDNWIRYRCTCEDLLSEKYLYAAGAGGYKDAAAPAVLLAERTEELSGREALQWMTTQLSTARNRADPDTDDQRNVPPASGD